MTDVLYHVGGLLAAIGGGGSLVLAMSSWLGKVWANRILEKERAEYALELEHLRSRLSADGQRLDALLKQGLSAAQRHYEAEFEILRRLWRATAHARGHMYGLRNPLNVAPAYPSETLDDRAKRIREKHITFERARNELTEAIYDGEPFYPEAIKDLASQLGVLATRELTQFSNTPQFSQEWMAEGTENRRIMGEKCAELSQLIRVHLDALKEAVRREQPI